MCSLTFVKAATAARRQGRAIIPCAPVCRSRGACRRPIPSPESPFMRRLLAPCPDRLPRPRCPPGPSRGGGGLGAGVAWGGSGRPAHTATAPSPEQAAALFGQAGSVVVTWQEVEEVSRAGRSAQMGPSSAMSDRPRNRRIGGLFGPPARGSVAIAPGRATDHGHLVRHNELADAGHLDADDRRLRRGLGGLPIRPPYVGGLSARRAFDVISRATATPISVIRWSATCATRARQYRRGLRRLRRSTGRGCARRLSGRSRWAPRRAARAPMTCSRKAGKRAGTRCPAGRIAPGDQIA